MNQEKAQEILKEYIQPDGGLKCLRHYMSWSPGDKEITLDCRFGVNELKAIAWWMQNTNPANLVCEHPGCDATVGVKDYRRTLEDFEPDGESAWSKAEMDDWLSEPIALCPEHADGREEIP